MKGKPCRQHVQAWALGPPLALFTARRPLRTEKTHPPLSAYCSPLPPLFLLLLQVEKLAAAANRKLERLKRGVMDQ